MGKDYRDMTAEDYEKMSFGERLVAALTDAAEVAAGRRKPAKIVRYKLTAREAAVHPPPDYPPERIRSVRRKLRLSQALFARALNVSLGTVRSWEQDVRAPSGPTERLLQIAERHPEVLFESIRAPVTDVPAKRSRSRR